jgi:hypothetical protein
MVSTAPKFGNKAINSAPSGNTTQNCGLSSTVTIEQSPTASNAPRYGGLKPPIDCSLRIPNFDIQEF